MRVLIPWLILSYLVAFGMNMHDWTETKEKHPWDIYSTLSLICAPLVLLAVIGGVIGQEWSRFLKELRQKDRQQEESK